MHTGLDQIWLKCPPGQKCIGAYDLAGRCCDKCFMEHTWVACQSGLIVFSKACISLLAGCGSEGKPTTVGTFDVAIAVGQFPMHVEGASVM